MNRYHIINQKRPFILLFLLFMAPFHHSYGQEQPVIEKKKVITHDPRSEISINYDDLTFLYKATVTRARTSNRIHAQNAQPSVGTRMSFGNKNPTRNEASRIFYHYIDEAVGEHVHGLRLAMAALPKAVPLQYLNRDEQLAFWLNLYNITVYDEIARRYPIRKLTKLYKGSRKTSSMWDEKLVTVNGAALSLNDIQYGIIHKIWPDPLVIYGLYQGAVGGPNMRRQAYTGKLVYAQLEDNATEFINSLRGLRFKKKVAEVSIIYDWNRALFPDFDNDLKKHLRRYTNFRLTTQLDNSRRIKTKIYDWNIADVLNGGRSSPGSQASTNPVSMLFSFGGEEQVLEGFDGKGPLDDLGNAPGAVGNQINSSGSAHGKKVIDTAVIRNRLPNNAAFFLKAFVRNRRLANTRVTMEEITKEELEKLRAEKNKAKDK